MFGGVGGAGGGEGGVVLGGGLVLVFTEVVKYLRFLTLCTLNLGTDGVKYLVVNMFYCPQAYRGLLPSPDDCRYHWTGNREEHS